MISAHLENILSKSVVIHGDRVSILNESSVRNEVIDKLIYAVVFGPQADRPAARWLIWEISQELGIRPSSIHPFYSARGRGIISADFTVPAMNFRGLTYDTSRALFKTAIKTETQAFI